MTLIFYDWEFYEDGKTINPISLGMVSELGDELYLVNEDFEWNKANNWLIENVKPQLHDTRPVAQTRYIYPRRKLANEINKWLLQQVYNVNKLELAGYYADYDHVLLAQQFGAIINLPKHIPMWTRDLKQWCNDLGDPELPPQGKGEHHALLDARWIRDSYNWLARNYDHPAWTPRLRKPRLKQSDCF